MDTDQISDEDLLVIIVEADDEGLKNGEDPSSRAFHNVLRAFKRLNIDNVVAAGPSAPLIVQRIHAANAVLFRPNDASENSFHVGAFMFRDIFCTFRAPYIMGRGPIDFLSLIDLSDFQKQWLVNSDQASAFWDQAFDILDFGYGWFEFGHKRAVTPRAKDLIWRSHVQLEAAAATATGGGDYRGTVQSALLGTELAIKAGLSANGISDTELKSKTIGHNLVAAVERLTAFEPGFDVDRVFRVVSRFPDLVASRYDNPPPTRIETGHILMGAQYVASEVTRQFADRNLRADNPSAPPRVYP